MKHELDYRPPVFLRNAPTPRLTFLILHISMPLFPVSLPRELSDWQVLKKEINMVILALLLSCLRIRLSMQNLHPVLLSACSKMPAVI